MASDAGRDDGSTVVLVHGLYMGPWAMTYLARRLRKAGLATLCVSYPTLRAGLPESADALAHQIDSLAAATVHYVAHSLGGLLVRHLFHRHPDRAPGRVVTLGTPHGGSYVGRWLQDHSFLGWVLGRSGPMGLLGGVPPWDGSHELGVIAGNVNLGLGQGIPSLPRPNDGTVTVQETGLAGAVDQIVLPVTHTGLLVSRTVADQVIAFLQNGRFVHGQGAAAHSR